MTVTINFKGRPHEILLSQLAVRRLIVDSFFLRQWAGGYQSVVKGT